MKFLSIALSVILATISVQVLGQQQTSPIIFIYDASGSMWGQIQGKTKKEIAAAVLTEAVENLPTDQKIGLVVYGHRKEGDCRDVEFIVDANDGSAKQVVQSLRTIKPLGKTPLAYSATTVIDKLRADKSKATVILVTDGIESCDGNICQVIRESREAGVDFKLHIIGFGLKANETEQLKCAAREGGGNYYDAADADGLGDVLNAATAATVDEPAGNLGVYAVKNGQAVDAVVKAYDIIAKRIPIVVRTYGDTALVYLPPSTYNLEVTPLAGSKVNPVTVKNISSSDEAITYQTVSFDAAKFNFITTNNGEGWDCTVKVTAQDGSSVGVTRTYGKPQLVEINPGRYNITIQALQMKGLHTKIVIEDVELAGGVVDLTHDFKTGSLLINPTVNGASIDCVAKIVDSATEKPIATGRTYTKGLQYTINPGTYNIKVTPLGAHKDKPSQTVTIEVKQGQSVEQEIKF